MSRWRLERNVFRLRPKAAEFLKAYATNTADKPRTAFVDLKGKIVATADQILLPDGEALIAVEKCVAGRLLGHLKNYLFLTDNTLEETSLAAVFDTDPAATGDRELPCHGGKILFVPKTEAVPADGEFTRFRLRNAWPLQGIDYDDELLLSVGNEEYVSYDKGCYLGQEIIARVHYKGKPPKRLEVVDADRKDLLGPVTSKAEVDGRLMGFAFVPA